MEKSVKWKKLIKQKNSVKQKNWLNGKMVKTEKNG